jgi:hypothetical protein
MWLCKDGRLIKAIRVACQIKTLKESVITATSKGTYQGIAGQRVVEKKGKALKEGSGTMGVIEETTQTRQTILLTAH